MEGEAGTPISVYLELQEGEFADWEVVSKASIQLIEALKELAAFADPSAHLKVTLQNSEEGSLRFNAILELFGVRSDPAEADDKRKVRRAAIAGVLGGATLWLFNVVGTHYAEMVLDVIDSAVVAALKNEGTGDPETVEETKQECRKLLDGATRNQVGAAHVRKFFRELKADQNIAGVGVALDHESPPLAIIPRSEFGDRSRPPNDDSEPMNRTRVETITVLLVEPRLLGDEKPWRFSVGGIEFSAKIEDREFVSATLSGRNSLPLMEGIYLQVRMRIEERREENAWVIKSRTILEVIGHEARPEQTLFPGAI